MASADIKGFIGRTTIASVAGGTGSALAGGKFANGAVTAAFAHMYNAEEHLRKAVARVIDSTRAALAHYFRGNGESVELGPRTKELLRNHPEQRRRSSRIRGRKTPSDSGNYGVDMTSRMYHVGRTVVLYNTSCFAILFVTTFTGFSNDGFWDPNILSTSYNDGLGPNAEFPGGTPYKYNPYTWREIHPNS